MTRFTRLGLSLIITQSAIIAGKIAHSGAIADNTDFWVIMASIVGAIIIICYEKK